MFDVIRTVNDIINAACKRSARVPDDVKLVAVSKRFPVQRITEAYESGLRIFGESKAQELRDKVGVLPENIEWHFIGHLQTNKVKYVVPFAELIHSVDSMHLAEAISDYALKNDYKPKVLMEVNTSAEQTKFGFDGESAIEAYQQINELPGLHICGLMTMAPFVHDENEIRQAFRKLKVIQEELKLLNSGMDVNELSMGMSQDYEIAIEEGSTIVRIGTAIFGKREAV